MFWRRHVDFAPFESRTVCSQAAEPDVSFHRYAFLFDGTFKTYPQGFQFFGERIPAFSGLGSSFDGRLNGLRALFFSSFDQPEFMSSVCFGPLEGGDEFGMGRGWSHEELIPEPWTRR